jgi:hypothetical protein
MRAWLSRIFAAILAVMCMAPGCSGDALEDSTFRLWCGEALCSWKLDTGHVQRAPTWHQDDYGVELVDAPTVISQKTTEGTDCMKFSAVGDVEAAADAKIGIDFDEDGASDYEQPIAETHWQSFSTQIYLPQSFGRRFRFIIQKNGAGRAVLAEIRLQNVESCSGSRIEVRDLATGDACTADTQCTSGICCGVDSDQIGMVRLAGACSQCCDARGCAANVRCAPHADIHAPIGVGHVPWQCAPGEGKGAAGDPCVEASDCASQACDGPRPIFVDPTCVDLATCDVLFVQAGKCR